MGVTADRTSKNIPSPVTWQSRYPAEFRVDTTDVGTETDGSGGVGDGSQLPVPTLP